MTRASIRPSAVQMPCHPFWATRRVARHLVVGPVEPWHVTILTPAASPNPERHGLQNQRDKTADGRLPS